MLAISSVYPSGLERTAASVPRLVLAPGRLSTTNGWPRRLLSPSLISRANSSDPPPAASDSPARGRVRARALSQAPLGRAAVLRRGGRVGKGARRASALANQTE